MFYIIGPAVTIVTVLVIIGWKKTRGEENIFVASVNFTFKIWIQQKLNEYVIIVII